MPAPRVQLFQFGCCKLQLVTMMMKTLHAFQGGTTSVGTAEDIMHKTIGKVQSSRPCQLWLATRELQKRCSTRIACTQAKQLLVQLIKNSSLHAVSHQLSFFGFHSWRGAKSKVEPAAFFLGLPARARTLLLLTASSARAPLMLCWGPVGKASEQPCKAPAACVAAGCIIQS